MAIYCFRSFEGSQYVHLSGVEQYRSLVTWPPASFIPRTLPLTYIAGVLLAFLALVLI